MSRLLFGDEDESAGLYSISTTYSESPAELIAPQAMYGLSTTYSESMGTIAAVSGTQSMIQVIS